MVPTAGQASFSDATNLVKHQSFVAPWLLQQRPWAHHCIAKARSLQQCLSCSKARGGRCAAACFAAQQCNVVQPCQLNDTVPQAKQIWESNLEMCACAMPAHGCLQ